MVDRGNGAACLVLEQAHKLAHSGQLVLWGGATAQVFQGNAGQTRQVPGEQPRGFFGGADVGGDKGFLQVGQLPLQAFGEELLLEAGGGAGLGAKWCLRDSEGYEFRQRKLLFTSKRVRVFEK